MFMPYFLTIIAIPLATLFGVVSYNFYQENQKGLCILYAIQSPMWLCIFYLNLQIVIGLRELGF